MISYYFIAALATLYVIVFSLDRISALNSPWKRIRALLRNKLNLFLDTSLLFSIAMLLAAVYRFISHLRHPDGVDENTFFYSLTNAITISIFTVFPPLILQFTERKQPPKVIRSILWFLVIILAMAITGLYYKWRGLHPISKYFDNNNNWRKVLNDHWKQALWLKFCDLNPGLLIRTLDRAILFAQGVLVFNVPCGIYHLFTVRTAMSRSANSSGPAFWFSLRQFNIILCCGTMWLLLVMFTAISARVADGMGPDSKDRKLSVGQVLAVATFVPLIVEIVGMDIGKGRALDLISWPCVFMLQQLLILELKNCRRRGRRRQRSSIKGKLLVELLVMVLDRHTKHKHLAIVPTGFEILADGARRDTVSGLWQPRKSSCDQKIVGTSLLLKNRKVVRQSCKPGADTERSRRINNTLE